MSRPRLLTVTATLLWALIACRPATPPGGDLMVIVVVDQMRFDYIERFGSTWTDGLARLTREGAFFENAFYPYLSTVTCPGHATISTGTYPATHGLINNEWWDRSAGRVTSCTEDPSVSSISYGSTREAVGHSAHRLRVPTLGDRLRAASPDSRVVTLSMKPRSSVMLAGHGGTAVTWFSDANSWATSTAFTRTAVPEVDRYVRSHPVESDRRRSWDRMFPESRYGGKDDGDGERPPNGWTRVFPHPFAGDPAKPRQFFDLWRTSPFADEALGAMAGALIDAFQLGRRGRLDFLGISFSALDSVGHAFGPDSHEVQDTLFRLDRTIGSLLTHLDERVGPDHYVLALSADHGVAGIPEALRAQGKDAGRLLAPELQQAAEAAMAAAYGPGPHISHVQYTDIYLTDAMRQRAAADPAVLQPLVNALSRVDGVLRVIPTSGLEAKRASNDPIERAAALTYVSGESGDVIVVLKPDWTSAPTAAATHGTLHSYDQHVPLVLFGHGVKPGRYNDAASPADIAPTLARVVKLDLAGTEGKPLTSALK